MLRKLEDTGKGFKGYVFFCFSISDNIFSIIVSGFEIVLCSFLELWKHIFFCAAFPFLLLAVAFSI